MCRRRFTLLTAALLSTLGVSSAGGQQPQIPWRSDLAAARHEAAQSGRNLLVHFWAPWCAPCRRLETVVFTQPEVVSAVEQGLVPVKLNADEYRQFAEAYGVDRLPTDLVLRPDGAVLGKFASPQDPAAYVAQITPFSLPRRPQEGLSSQQLAGVNGPTAGNQPIQNAYMHLNPSPTPPHDASLAAGPNAMVRPEAGGGYGGMTPAGGAYRGYGAPQPSAETVPVGNPAVANHSVPSGPGMANASLGTRYDTFPGNMASTPGHAPAAGSAGGVAVSSAAMPPLASEPSPSPLGQPPLGLDGYCPVTLKKQRQWVAGDKRYGIYHRGCLYLFAGPHQQQQFWHDPDAFSPVLSGLDPVLAFDNGASVQGQREHGVEFGGLVYLFSSESTLQHFSRNPERYAGGVRQAMQPGSGAGSGATRR